MTQLELIFVYGVRKRVVVHFFACEYSVVPAPYVEKTIFPLLNLLTPLSKSIDHKCEGFFLASKFYPIYLFLRYYYTLFLRYYYTLFFFIYWSYILKICWTHLLLLIFFYVCGFFRIFFYKIMSSLNRQFYFFLFEMGAFFSCIITLARTSSTVLNRSGKNWHPCLVPDLGEKTVFHH